MAIIQKIIEMIFRGSEAAKEKQNDFRQNY